MYRPPQESTHVITFLIDTVYGPRRQSTVDG